MQSLLVITGAGISLASGIPTYRGAGANLPILSIDDIGRDEFWSWADRVRAIVSVAVPNGAHHILAELEKRCGRFLIATQNIDGLHQEAGSKNVTELHGNIWQISKPRAVDYAEDPGFSDDYMMLENTDFRDEILKRWSEENGRDVWEDRAVPFNPNPPCTDEGARPNVLMLDEPYGTRLLWVRDFIKNGVDQVLVIGCSGGVQIVNRLIADAKEANPHCVVTSINPGVHKISGVDAEIQMEAIDGLIHFQEGQQARNRDPQ